MSGGAPAAFRRGIIAAADASAGGSGPTTPILDNFNRADENPLSGGGNWASRNVNSQLKLVSNQCQGSSPLLDSNYWAASTFGPNCEAYISVPVLGASTSYIRLWLRLSSAGISTETGYMMQWMNDGTNGLRIFKETSRETYTTLAQDISKTFTAGAQVCFRAVGTALSVINNGTVALTVTDSTYSAAGNIALGCRDTAYRMDNFGGGTL